ncbi:glycosyltransferase family 4 protein [Solemya elarraichensis gill symbiont]|uniref:Glycosyl transferase family 1 domain-containing protein n=1 Tax=Solemya elarraichensis gill symbiont TaxID=1918949 RepID=A0A1T2LC93_9GAMM|nr:glycosyltransferase family 4 protein [Solemya elarraichensis gill symbiont]OOZ42727.1 hypothetical protein BOW52_01835 [Solemya elarraichensis gill symbiont]
MSLTDKPAIATVLPPRESFGEHKAGALGIDVRDWHSCSQFRSNWEVYGGAQISSFKGITYHPVEARRLRLWSRTEDYARLLVRELRKKSPAIVEIHNRVSVFLTLAKKLPNVRVCLFVHNDPMTIKGAKKASERKQILQAAAQVYCVSNYLKQRLLQGTEGFEDKVKVVSLALPADEIRDKPAHSRKELVFISRMVPEKGALELAKALAIVLPKHPEWRSIFIGARHFGGLEPSTDFENEVINTLTPLGEQVEYRNSLPHSEVMQALEAAEIAVVPSIIPEGFGRTAMEALACGCALISSRNGALPEVCGDAAIMLSEVSTDALVDAISKLLTDEHLRTQMQKQAIEWAQDRFSLQKQTATLDNYRCELLGRTGI